MNSIPAPIIFGLLASVPAAPLLVKIAGQRAPYFLGIVPLAAASVLLLAWMPVGDGETYVQWNQWVPSLDLAAGFRIDGLSLAFAVLVLLMGALVLVYSRGYMAGTVGSGSFYAYLMLFMAAMVGLSLSDNIITLFIFWELTSVSSYMLIGFRHSSEPSRDSALQALIVTSAGGLALMGGLVMLAIAAGSWEISEIIQRADLIARHSLAIPSFVLIAAGAFTKSAQAPFHFWLPNQCLPALGNNGQGRRFFTRAIAPSAR